MESGFRLVFRNFIYSKEMQGLNSEVYARIHEWMLFVNIGMPRCLPL